MSMIIYSCWQFWFLEDQILIQSGTNYIYFLFSFEDFRFFFCKLRSLRFYKNSKFQQEISLKSAKNGFVMASDPGEMGIGGDKGHSSANLQEKCRNSESNGILFYEKAKILTILIRTPIIFDLWSLFSAEGKMNYSRKAWNREFTVTVIQKIVEFTRLQYTKVVSLRAFSRWLAEITIKYKN